MGTHHMSAVDHAWLRMDRPGNLLVVNALAWSGEPVDVAALRRVVVERMVERFPRFRQRPARAPNPLGRAVWADDEDFDLDRHVRLVALPPPGDRAELQRYVGACTGIPLDPARPLWELHVISGFGQGSAVLMRVHHAVADGISLMRLMLSLADDGPSDGFEPVRDPGPVSSVVRTANALAVRGLGLVRHPARVPGLIGTVGRDVARLFHLATLPATPPSVLTGEVGVAKRVTWTEPIDLASVKVVGRATGTTVNDVLLAALGGALGAYLAERGTPLSDVRVMMPVNLRPLDRPMPAELGNAFGFFVVDLPASPMAPAERLAVMRGRIEALKSSPEALVSYGIVAGLGAAPKPVEDLGTAFFSSRAVGIVTNVPGPSRPVRLAGGRVDGFVGWVPRGGEMGLGVAITSYDGMVTVGFATDAGLIADPERIQDLLAAELGALVAACCP